MASPIALLQPTNLLQAGTACAYFLRSIPKVVMRNVCSRFSLKSSQTKGKGTLLATFILLARFGMFIPPAQAQSTTNVLGFAKAADAVMESEGITTLMVVPK